MTYFLKSSLLCTLAFFFFSFSNAQIVINEGSNRNYNAITDEDNEHPDWIELYNTGNDTISLLNYTLTDDSSLPAKWSIPNFELAPHAYKIIFCSGKDRKPVSGFTEVLNTGTFTPVTGWNNHQFTRPFYWDGVSNIVINTCSYSNTGYTTNSVFNQTEMPYNATAFSFVDNSADACNHLNGGVSRWRPNIKINGRQIGFGTINNGNLDYPAPYGNWYWSARHQMIIPASELNAAGLTAGNINNLAFDVVSTDPNTVYTYFIINMKLVTQPEVSATFLPLNNALNLHTNFSIKPEGETVVLYNPQRQPVSRLLVNAINPNNSKGCVSDGSNNIVYFNNGTPGNSNNNNSGSTSYLQQPSFSLASGMYSVGQQLTMSNPNPSGTQIYYSLDGSDPTTSSILYTGGNISIGASKVVKARCFGNTALPSPLKAASYLINISHTTPVISVITQNSNLYGPTGIFDNWSSDWQRPAYAECFNTDKALIFSQPAAIQIDGGAGGSRSNPQHSFRLELDNSVLGGGPVYYPLIPDKPNRKKYSKLYLRNGSNQFLRIPYKDACGVKVLCDETNNYYSAYRPVSVYINGAYFGLYELREKFDEEFFNETEGADSTDILSLSYWYGGILRALSGSVDSFYRASNIVSQLDPNDPEYCKKADKYFDLNYYHDYIIAESFIHNTDWPYNNIKIYRSEKTNNRYRYAVIDVELALTPYGWSSSDDDPIDFLKTRDPNIPYINLWLRGINNREFKNYFINRYADLLNTAYLPNNLAAKENKIFTEMQREMPKEYARWGDPNNINQQMLDFNNNHLMLKAEYTSRGQKVRNFINSGFNLFGQVNVTLNVYPAGAGKIKISTITPESYPWQGIYFYGNPVKIEAIPNEGYSFSHWDPNALLQTLDTSRILLADIPASTQFKAYFIKTPFGIPEANSSHFLLYPNPGKGLFSVYLNDVATGKYELKIFNSVGQLVRKDETVVIGRNGIFNPDIRQLPNGMYVVVIAGNNEKTILKYIKNNNE
jgi:hypothetical protein